MATESGRLSLVPLLLTLVACTGPSAGDRPRPVQGEPEAWSLPDGPPTTIPAGIDRVPDAVPRPEPRSGRGNPPFYEVFGQRYFVMDSAVGHVERGIASWYGSRFHGRPTSSGEPYDMFAMTAAHRNLPLPTYARVTNLENDRSVVVRINDRGPFAHNRVIDLSYAAALRLDIIGDGTGLVEVVVLDPLDPDRAPAGRGRDAPLHSHPTLYLQVGAFSQEDNAMAVVSRLRNANLYNVQLIVLDGESPLLWRVRVGPLADVDEVDSVDATLGELGFTDARVVIEQEW